MGKLNSGQNSSVRAAERHDVGRTTPARFSTITLSGITGWSLATT
jgi:hypothetical protein